MMNVVETAVAGTLESSDILIRVEEISEPLEIVLESSVENQFGETIKDLIKDVVLQLGVENIRIVAMDRGALDCTIRARLITAIHRACGETGSRWEATR